MGRKRKLHLGTTPIGGKALKSRRKAREVTSQYHNIQNELSILTKNHTALPKVTIEKTKSDLLKKLDAIGGVDKYQQASIISTSHFKTSRWVISVLESLGRKPPVQENRKSFHVLEVGAINIQLQQCDWMSVRSIDLHSQHPSIEEIDFFAIEPQQQYDCVVCSMVINCVPDPKKRGEMLARLYAHLQPDSGVLFLVLPLRCVQSKHVGQEQWDALLTGTKAYSFVISHQRSMSTIRLQLPVHPRIPTIKHIIMLTGMGFSSWVEKRITPRLVFYVLGRASSVMGLSDEDKSRGGAVKSSSSSSDRITTNKSSSSSSSSSSSINTSNSRSTTTPITSHNRTHHDKNNHTDRIDDDWFTHTCTRLNHHLSSVTKAHFTQSLDHVPPTEFCLSLRQFIST